MIEILYPKGKKKAMTMSYDDGQIYDRRLVEIFNKYNIKGTFHLNSGTLGKEEMISAEEVTTLYIGHEVSCHSVHHPYFNQLSKAQLTNEILEDKRALETLADTIIRGMSYPFGQYSSELFPILKAAGMEYSRTVIEDHTFGWPADFMQWHPTCHHGSNLMELLKEFQNPPEYLNLPLFYVWGHSFEFHRQNNWNLIEEFCKEAGNDDEVWYATNIEIKDYICAVRSLIFNVNETKVYNPSGQTICIKTENGIEEIIPMETRRI